MDRKNISTDIFMKSVEEPVLDNGNAQENTQQPVINVDSFTNPQEMVVEEKHTEAVVEKIEIVSEGTVTEDATGDVNAHIEKFLKKDRGDGTVPVIEFKNITQIFNDGEENEYKLFQNFSLTIPDYPGEHQAIGIMGPSGCGKSRLVRVLCGLDTVQSGEVFMYGKKLDGSQAIPMCFQNYSSFPWMTVRENVALPMKIRNFSKEDIEQKTNKLLEVVGMSDKADNYTDRLSGGQQQRVAIARSLATESQIIVMDESTSALDIKMKREVDNTLLKVLYDYEQDPTLIMISHNVEEVLLVCNHVVILKPNPCSVHFEMDIKYPGEEERPRGEWIIETPEYAEYMRLITKAMEEIC